MPRPNLGCLLALAALTACGVVDSTTATLPPLSSDPVPSRPTDDSVPLRPTPYLAWYEQHRPALNGELDAIRALSAELSSATDEFVEGMVCLKGANLDDPRFVAATNDTDAHPVWVELVAVTRWMIASCAHDGAKVVVDLLPRIDEKIARFEAWLAQVGAVGEATVNSAPATSST